MVVVERKIPSIDFDKEQIDAETRTNLSSDLFDSKQREIDLAIKKQKLLKRILIYYQVFNLIIHQGRFFSLALMMTVWLDCQADL